MLIEFDLQKALSGAKVVTRDNQEVTDIHHFKNSRENQKVFGLVTGMICSFYNDGSYAIGKEQHRLDLFLEVSPKTYYVDVFNHMHAGINLGEVCTSMQECCSNRAYKECLTNQYIKTIEFTDMQEGEL